MRIAVLPLVAAVSAVFLLSCSVPGSGAMADLRPGMSRGEVRAVMQSNGLRPDDSRKRPPGGWEAHGQDPFAAGSMAGVFEREEGRQVEWAEVYHVAGRKGSSVINLYYDGDGSLIR